MQRSLTFSISIVRHHVHLDALARNRSPPRRSKKNWDTQAPEELLILSLSGLKVMDLVRLQSVCRRLRKVVSTHEDSLAAPIIASNQARLQRAIDDDEKALQDFDGTYIHHDGAVAVGSEHRFNESTATETKRSLIQMQGDVTLQQHPLHYIDRIRRHCPVGGLGEAVGAGRLKAYDSKEISATAVRWCEARIVEPFHHRMYWAGTELLSRLEMPLRSLPTGKERYLGKRKREQEVMEGGWCWLLAYRYCPKSLASSIEARQSSR